jgi:outer membrane biogenesis lipoprotein LolB
MRPAAAGSLLLALAVLLLAACCCLAQPALALPAQLPQPAASWRTLLQAARGELQPR